MRVSLAENWPVRMTWEDWTIAIDALRLRRCSSGTLPILEEQEFGSGALPRPKDSHETFPPRTRQNQRVCFQVFSIPKTSFLTFLSQSRDILTYFGYLFALVLFCCPRQGILSNMECGDVLGVKIMRQAAKLLSKVCHGEVWGEGNSWTPVATHLMLMRVKGHLNGVS